MLARHGRQVPDATIRAVIDDAASGVWPDLVFLVDVDPSVARGRRKVAKILAREQRPASRKGLAGSGLQTAPARRLLERWRRAIPTAGSSSTTRTRIWTQVVAAITDTDRQARARARRPPWRARAPRRAAATGRQERRAPVDSPEEALAAFLDWVD